jgi:DNA polymerase-3 subunit delta'
MKVVLALPWVADVWNRVTQQAQIDRLGHALLLVGQEGTGKRLVLREFSQYLLCSSGDNKPCGQCGSCKLFDAGSHPDLLMVEPEEAGKQIKIEQIRKVTDFVNTTAQLGNKKVVLLGPAEAMNQNSSNALLKSLEEPSAHVTLLLYSHQPSSLLATIKSRCQQHTLYPPSWDQGLQWLQDNCQESGLDSLLRLAKGAPLKALSMVEQDVHVQYMQFCQGMKDLQNGQAVWSELMAKWKGWDTQNILQWFYEMLLDVQKAKSGLSAAEYSVPEMASITENVAQTVSYGQMQGLIDKLVNAQGAVRSTANPNAQLLIETLIIDWLGLLGQAQH